MDDQDILFEKFMKQAVTLGIEDKPKYVQECFERLERKEERELLKEKEELAAQLQKEEIAARERKEDKDRQERERDRAAQERDNERDAQTNVLLEREKTKQMELQRGNVQNDSGPYSRHSSGPKPVFPKLPMFKENTDDIDAYISRFEKHARNMKWEENDWVDYLAALLEGSALKVYHGLLEKETCTYKDLKDLLLKKFQCTSDGFRKRFREARPEANEPFDTFGMELTRLLNRWISLSELEDTREGLRDLILTEQFLESVNLELAIHIREKGLKTLDEMIAAAEYFRLARPGRNLARKSTASAFSVSDDSQVDSYENSANSIDTGKLFRGRWNQRNRGGVYKPQVTTTTGNQAGRGGSRGGFRTRGSRGRGGRGALATQQCYICNEKGHGYRTCPTKKSGKKCTICDIGGHDYQSCPFVFMRQHQDVIGNACIVTGRDPEVVCSVLENSMGKLHFQSGSVNDIPSSVLRDTGATICGVRKRLVSESQYVPGKVRCRTFGGEVQEYRQAKVTVSCEFFEGELLCCVLENPVADLIIGNIPGLKVRTDISADGAVVEPVAAVTTRAQAKKQNLVHKPLVQVAQDLNVSREKLIHLQGKDDGLKACFKLADSGEVRSVGGNKYSFFLDNGVLCRLYQSSQDSITQIVVPCSLRSSVLTTAHDQLLAGHCGVRRTLSRILSQFFWPGVSADVRRYVHTCDICQKTTPKGRIPPVPLATMPTVSTPFEKVAIDLVGPLSPPSEQGHRYILTLIDVATRFPEAVPMKDISSISVAEALMSIFARLGFPKVILSDQGTQFNSDLMKEFHKLCGTEGVRTSPYHPQANGTVERFHGTLKAMLRKVIQAQPRAWHRYLPALLFACRELPSESTGFSPFELMFGRKPRGPIALLADTWTQKDPSEDEEKPLYKYLFDLKNIIVESCEIAKENSEKSARVGKKYFDRKARQRSFAVGDEVLVLLPSSSNKLMMTWSGPFPIQECLHPDYRILIRGKLKVFHANMLKKYNRRSEVASVAQDTIRISVGESVPWSDILPLSMDEDEKFVGQCDDDARSSARVRQYGPVMPTLAVVGVVQEEDDSVSVPTIPFSVPMSPTSEEDITDVDFCPSMPSETSKRLRQIYKKYEDRLTAKPGALKSEVVISIQLTSDIPVHRKAYDLPFSSKQVVDREIDAMMDLGVIEPSTSPYSSPVVLVRKKDGTCRFCVDYRALNKITIFDAEPIPDVDELFSRLAEDKVFTRIDLAKGYWQILVDPVDRHKTAFATHRGLFQWIRMPFGLVNAPAVFARMMRTLNLEEASSMNFFDDILIHSKSYQEHFAHTELVLKRLKEFNLTARPSKISAGYPNLEFLGHVVGEGQLRPEPKKIQKILEIPTPSTKKQVRSLLGLLGFYRRYIPNFASLTAPLSDLTKDTKTRTITWTSECERALKRIKELFSMSPVLQLPNLNQSFTVQTDASSAGIGAVLLQENGGVLHPVCYASRKLLDRETRYSTIERECLAIVWGIGKFSKYLWGMHFILQTDHRPLTYLNTSRFKNSRIMRWALSLQEYRFSVESLPGTSNVLADLLSRSDSDQLVP